MPTHRYFLPDFLEIQREGFLNFLKKGILEEFSKRNPITSRNVDLFFYPEYFCLTKPDYSVQQAIFFQKSYISNLYIPVQYTDKKRKLIVLKWVLIAQLPLMTKRGHFVLNGAARVIINQLVRSPGVYFLPHFYEIYLNKWASKPSRILQRFYADIICFKGTWVRLAMDKDFCMWVRLKKGPKIPLLWFLLGMGLNEKMIFQSVISPNFLLKSFPKNRIYPYVSTTPEAWKEIAKLFQLKKTRKKKGPINIYFQKFYKAKLGSEFFQTKFSQLSNINTSKTGTLQQQPINHSLIAKIGDRSLFPHHSSQTMEHMDAPKPSSKLKEKIDFSNLGRKWFFQKFMNPRTYDLGKKGRMALNKKLGLNLSIHQTTLTAQDLLFITDFLMKVEKRIYDLDDIDHLKNKRIRSAGELIQMQFGIGLMRLEKSIRLKLTTKSKKFSISRKSYQLKQKSEFYASKIKKAISSQKFNGSLCGFFGAQKTPENQRFSIYRKKDSSLESEAIISLNSLIQPKFLNGALKEFFGTHPLSQFMDQINPLAEITHKRRLTSLGPGGVARDTATLAIRGIHPSHYGRICPIETPEGKNTGLVNSLTVYAHVNHEGLIESPFYKLYKGHILPRKVSLLADQEENFQIATPDLNITKKKFLPKQKIPVRFGKTFFNSSALSISFIGISTLQMISVATSLIPFLEHDDANRALMGSNMQRQAVPLIRPERPLVGTGLEAKAISDSGHALTASNSGFILYASGSQIRIWCDFDVGIGCF